MNELENKINELNNILKGLGCSNDLSVVHGKGVTGNSWVTISLKEITVIRIEHENEKIINCSSPISEINEVLLNSNN